MNKQTNIETQAVHAGEPRERAAGAVVVPVYQSATFESLPGESYDDIRYARLSNTPNHSALHAKLAILCAGEAAIVTGSGMAAISTTLMSLLKSGDHMLAQDCLYGGTRGLLTEDAPALGIEYDLVKGNEPDTWASLLRPNTRVLYVETMSNPLLEVPDLEAVVAFARGHELISVVDNTFASPVDFKPLEMGFDLEIHSATKYLNGHSDIVAGAVVGSAALIGKVTHKLNHLGGSLDAHACFLLHRGLRTLALRMRQHNANGQALAEFLENQSQVKEVNYPGLKSHPQHERAARLFNGCGGVLSFELAGGVPAAERLIEALELPISAPSLGGVECLITRPASTSHKAMTAAQREEIGLSEGLVRVAAGIEAAEDLCADFAQALERV
jgi:cystathionine beta-lyase/cystathionine gamma-synthase